MKARTIALVLATGALVAVSIPGAAGAATGPASRLTPPSIDQQIVGQGSNGFKITVSVHDRHYLELSADKPGRGLSFETAAYTMPIRQPAGPTEIRARLGKLGQIDMRFHPEKVEEVSSSEFGCKGDKTVEEEGRWVGSFAFRGEQDFTDVRVRSAPGVVTKVPPLRCRPGRPPGLGKIKRRREALEKAKEKDESASGEEGPRAFSLVATARHRFALVATRGTLGKGRDQFSIANLIVTGSRHRGRIEESAFVADLFAPGSYVKPVDSHEPTAEVLVKPRAPFAGSATYRAPPGKPRSWGGDLTVDLPIFGVVHLAGRGSRATACESAVADCAGGGLGRRASALLERLPR